MKYMLDTDICIYIIKKKPAKELIALQKADVGQVCISSITLAELEYGVAKSQHKEKNQIALAEFLTPIEILDFNDCAARMFGTIRAELEAKGKVIGPFDLQIAAHALAEKLTLITKNKKEFSRVPNLKIKNWL
jgi:tRNA(fMet)-specific endonuclease VapC